MPKSPPNDLIVMGQVLAPYGVKGWLRVRPYTETLTSLLEYPKWWIDARSGWFSATLITGKPHGNCLLAKIEGFDTPEALAPLLRCSVAVPKSKLPELSSPQSGEYYWNDLIGLTVINTRKIVLGSVVGLMETGVHDILRVQPLLESTQTTETSEKQPCSKKSNYSPELLIPFTAPITHTVDLATKTILVDWESDY